MFRAKVLNDQMYKNCIERYNTEEARQYREKYGFDDWEIWNLDYTFLCFIFLHLKAIEDSDCKKDPEIQNLMKRSQELIRNGYNIEDSNSPVFQVFQDFVKMIPKLWS